ncbi:MAG: hypothetical protein V8R08_03835 [Coriobacteriales bacterium]
MRKSNIIVLVILVLLSLEFLWLWNHFGFSLTDPADLAITIVWWLVIIGVAVAIVLVEKRRRERIRSVFVADGVLYNCETGLIRLGDERDAKDYVKMIRHALNGLDYGAEAKLSKNQPRLHFRYIVRSKKFSDGGRVWTGELVNVRNPQDNKPFASVNELMQIFDAGVL